MYKTGGVFEMTETDPGLAAIFATYPATYLSLRGAIVDQVSSLETKHSNIIIQQIVFSRLSELRC